MASWVFSSIQSLSSKVLDAVRGAPSGADRNEGVREDVEKLSQLLARIQAVLQDAEEREINDRSVRLWLVELRGVAYRAEDVLDEFQYELLRSVVECGDAAIESYHKGKNKEVAEKYTSLSPGSCSSNNTRTSILDGMAEKIKIIIDDFEEITKDREALNLREEDGARLVTEGPRIRPPTSSQVDERSIFGREDEKKRIINVLNPFDGPDFMVLAILGMGGLGKTTLAQLVYNDSMFGRFFQKKSWVSVSENFDLVHLTKAIVESVTDSPCSFSELSKLRDVLTENISGTSLFLVLDDVWNATESVWNQCRAGFIGAKTVRILMTTRNTMVAEIMQTTSPLMLEILPKEKCRLLFKHFAFHKRKASENATLLEIGDGIVDKCKGSPLAIKVLGGMLRYDTDEEKWREVLESDLLDIDESGEIFPILHLSYRKLPLHLRPCFLFLSIFPKETRFIKETVIRLWMAQGYISGNSRTNKTLEEIGTSYFDELHGRSLIDYRDTSYRLHDLMHDLARFISWTRNRHASDNDQPLNKTCKLCHLYFTEKNELSELLEPCYYRAIRTFILEDTTGGIFDSALFFKLLPVRALELGHSFLPDTIGTLKHLRYLHVSFDQTVRLSESLCLLYNLQTLHLSCTNLLELPKKIKNLVNLRYIYLQSSKLETLPKSIYLLQNLQTLSVENCPSLNTLPRGIAQLTGLRVLMLPKMAERGPRTFNLPYGIRKLTALETLSGYFNLMDDCRDFLTGGLRELEDINKIRGLLCILGLKNINESESSKMANLALKTNLKKIILNFRQADHDGPICAHEDFHLAVYPSKVAKSTEIDREIQEGILETLRPNGNLRELQVLYYQGRRSPSWLLSSLLPKLEVLILECCNEFQLLQPFGPVPNLKVFRITGSTHDKETGSPSSYNSCLAMGEVFLGNMHKLVQWPLYDRGFPRIKELEIHNCPYLSKLPPIWGEIKVLTINKCGCEEIKFSSQSKIQRISISNCRNLVTIYNTNKDLSAVEHISLSDRPELFNMVNYAYEFFPFLETISISNCLKLRNLSVNPAKLSTLKIYNCGFREMMLPQICQSLEINGCPELYSLHWWGSAIYSFEKSVTVRFIDCPELRLVEFPKEVEKLTILSCNIHHIILPQQSRMKSMIISDCLELISVHGMGGNVSYLSELTLSNCPNLIMSLHFLESHKSIRNFSVRSCPQFDKVLIVPCELEELTVTDCSFPRICLLSQSKLHKLIISACSNLVSVEGLNSRFSWTELWISDCPILEFSSDVLMLQHIMEVLEICNCPRIDLG